VEDAMAYPDPDNIYLRGPFAPAEETDAAVECAVTGKVPPEIRGEVREAQQLNATY
jgi:hypothetical protein